MATNYLPFAKRAVVTVPANGGRVATSVFDLSIGGGVRAHLGDLAIAYDSTQIAHDIPAHFEYQLQMRLGIVGRGYLTEGFYTINLYRDGRYPESGVWHFPKPYRVFPGQRLRSMWQLPNNGFNLGAYPQLAAIAFNGRRVKDGEPVVLHDRAPGAAVLGGTYLLNGETLGCPADSPVDLYSVIGPCGRDRYNGLVASVIYQGIDWNGMVWGPDDRQWWDQIQWPQLLNPPCTLVDLDKPEWIMGPQEGITVEFVNYHTVAAIVYVTLRGSLEVES